MSENIYSIIMSGGSGTRFWPYSRNDYPKQFLDLLGMKKSLIQMTYERLLNISETNKIWTVTHQRYKTLIQQQLPQLTDEQILYEPLKCNTAPCIAYAAYKIYKKDPSAMMVITPADHLIVDYNKFEATIKVAIEEAKRTESLITLGTTPTHPETEYGYINFEPSDKEKSHSVKKFTEKPNLETAKQYVKENDFLWNSGIFIWKVSTIVNAFEMYQKELASAFQKGEQYYYSSKEQQFIHEVYASCQNISIDYAILENANNVRVVPATFDWSDLGSWNALYNMRPKDQNNNVLENDAISIDTKNCFIRGKKGKLIVAQGLENHLVVDFDDVLLICKKDDPLLIRKIVDKVSTIYPERDI